MSFKQLQHFEFGKTSGFEKQFYSFFMTVFILNCELIITGNVNGPIALKSELLCLVIKQVQQCQLPPACMGPMSPCKEAVTLSRGN